MRVGTYPTRDFATLGMLLLIKLHFSTEVPKWGLAGPVISAGLYMSPYRSDYIFPLVPSGVWRIVSEDSQECPHRSLDGLELLFKGLSC